MQLRSLSKRLAPWLTTYLFIVSVGLPLQRVYCACMDVQWVTVLPEELHDCHHDAKVAEAPHHHKGASACHKEEDQEKQGCSSHDCGKAEVLLAQLDADFTADKESFSPVLTLILPPATSTTWLERLIPTATAPIRGPAPPPLLSGRDILVAHQTFLI